MFEKLRRCNDGAQTFARRNVRRRRQHRSQSALFAGATLERRTLLASSNAPLKFDAFDFKPTGLFGQVDNNAVTEFEQMLQQSADTYSAFRTFYTNQVQTLPPGSIEIKFAGDFPPFHPFGDSFASKEVWLKDFESLPNPPLIDFSNPNLQNNDFTRAQALTTMLGERIDAFHIKQTSKTHTEPTEMNNDIEKYAWDQVNLQRSELGQSQINIGVSLKYRPWNYSGPKENTGLYVFYNKQTFTVRGYTPQQPPPFPVSNPQQAPTQPSGGSGSGSRSQLPPTNTISNTPAGQDVWGTIVNAANQPGAAGLSATALGLPSNWSPIPNDGGSPNNGGAQVVAFSGPGQVAVAFGGSDYTSDPGSYSPGSGAALVDMLLPYATETVSAILKNPATAGDQIVTVASGLFADPAQVLSLQDDLTGYSVNPAAIPQQTINADPNYAAQLAQYQQNSDYFAIDTSGAYATSYNTQAQGVLLASNPTVLPDPYAQVEQQAVAMAAQYPDQAAVASATEAYAASQAQSVPEVLNIEQQDLTNPVTTPPVALSGQDASSIVSATTSCTLTSNVNGTTTVYESGGPTFAVAPGTSTTSFTDFTMSSSDPSQPVSATVYSSDTYAQSTLTQPDGQQLAFVSGQGDVVSSGYTNVDLLDNTQATVNGSGDPINVASGDSVTVNGSGDTIDGSSATIALGTGATGDTITGDSDAISATNGNSLAVDGSDDNVNSTGAQVAMGSTDSGNTVTGNSNLLSAASGDSLTVDGSGDVVDGSSVGVNLGSGDSGDTVAGSDDAIDAARGDTLAIAGSNDTLGCFVVNVEMERADTGDTVTGDGNTIDGEGDDTVAVDGTGDYLTGPSDMFAMDAGDTGDTVGGDGDLIVPAVADTIAVDGPNDVVSGSDVTVGFGSNASGDTVAGDSDTIDAANGDSFAVDGSGDNIDCFVSQVEMVPGDKGDTLSGDNDSIAVGNGDSFSLSGSGDVVDGSSIGVKLESGDIDDTVSGSDDALNAADGDTLAVAGSNDTIVCSIADVEMERADAGDTVTGDGDTIDGLGGDSVAIDGNADYVTGPSDTFALASGDSGDTVGGDGDLIVPAVADTVAVERLE